MLAKERLHYIDIARGLLIIMVVFYHTMLRVDVPIATRIWNQFSCISFFMAGFFIITGLITNFSRDSWMQFIWKKFKSIIIPTVTFIFIQHWLSYIFKPTTIPQWFGLPLDIFLGKMPWFIAALFFSLLINYALIHYCKRKRYVLLASFSIYILGVILHTQGWVLDRNGVIYSINHIFTMNIFITIGYLLKDIRLRWWYLIITIPLFEAIVLSTNFIPMAIPYVTGGTIYLDYISMIPFLTMATCGSVTIIILCKFIGENSVLEYVGKHTLGIYILQMALISPLLQLLLLRQSNLSVYSITIIFFIVVMLVVLIGCMISQIFNSKYLKWLLGKF